MPNVKEASPAGGVLALVPDDWSDPWQRRHHVLTRLAAHFPVAWVSPPEHWSERLRLRAKHGEPVPNAARMCVIPSRDGAPSVRRPRVLAQAIYRRRVLQGLDWLTARGCRAIELQLWRPEFAPALDWIPHQTSSYHIDDEYSWSEEEQPLSQAERQLLERCDRVFVTSPKLLERKGGINSDTRFSSNGVDYAAFSAPAAGPNEFSRIARPRVGYVGVLKEQLDWPLLTTLASTRPDWSFVLIGPVRKGHERVQQALGSLAKLPNVHMIGERRPAELPGYLQHLDVALLPYRRNAYTDCINPLKLYEALAAGTPLVASRLRSLEDFARVVRLADCAEAFGAGIAAALGEETADRKRERQRMARAYDWDRIVQPIASSVAEALGVGERRRS